MLPQKAHSTLESAWDALRPGGWVMIRQLNSALDIPGLGPMFDWLLPQVSVDGIVGKTRILPPSLKTFAVAVPVSPLDSVAVPVYSPIFGVSGFDLPAASAVPATSNARIPATTMAERK